MQGYKYPDKYPTLNTRENEPERIIMEYVTPKQSIPEKKSTKSWKVYLAVSPVYMRKHIDMKCGSETNIYIGCAYNCGPVLNLSL